MKAYSLDLRERVVAAVTAGTPRVDVLLLFQISQATLTRYLNQHRTNHTRTARPHGGGRRRAIPVSHHHALSELIASDPDATLAHLCAMWAQRMGVHVSQATMCRTLAALGWSRKKRP